MPRRRAGCKRRTGETLAGGQRPRCRTATPAAVSAARSSFFFEPECRSVIRMAGPDQTSRGGAGENRFAQGAPDQPSADPAIISSHGRSEVSCRAACDRLSTDACCSGPTRSRHILPSRVSPIAAAFAAEIPSESRSRRSSRRCRSCAPNSRRRAAATSMKAESVLVSPTLNWTWATPRRAWPPPSDRRR